MNRQFYFLSQSRRRCYSDIPKKSVPDADRFKLAKNVLLDRKVRSINQIMHTVEQRVATQISTRKAHRILPLGEGEVGTDQVQLLARNILLEQRKKSSATVTDKHGVPILTPLNGVGNFVLPLQRVLFTYCSHNCDSDGMRAFLMNQLRKIAEENRGVEFVVEARWGEFPLIRGFYVNGNEKVLCAKNMNAAQVKEEFMKIRDCAGNHPKPFHMGVKSKAPAIRSMWSPFHMLNGEKNDPLGHFKRINPQKQQ